MFNRSALLSVAAVAVLAGCAAPADKAAPSASPEPLASTKAAVASKDSATASAARAPTTFGAPITEADETSLGDIAKEPNKFVNHTVKTEGIVTAVCQHMGCWMEIGDPTNAAHIRMAGHSFFIPKDAAGRHAIVEAKVLESGPPKAECAHEGKDSCAPADGSSKLQLEATGVELVD